MSHGENNIRVFVGHKLGVNIAHVHPLRLAGSIPHERHFNHFEIVWGA
jgi:hypothetical protein